MRMTFLLLIASIVPALSVLAGEPGFRGHFVGGTVAGCPSGAAARLDLTSSDSLVIRGHCQELRVPYRKINSLEYGQNVSRRYAEAILISPVLLLSKSRKHFVTIAFSDGSGMQQALVVRVDKKDIRPMLASLEARTGRRVEYQDDEARKAGR